MKLCIADPPYLGRAVRWYGKGGCGNGYGAHQADNHPDAAQWDDPETHRALVRRLEEQYDGWAIAMSVHSLSTYLSVVETGSRNGIRIAAWHKPSSYPSGSRIANMWEPVLLKIPKERRGHAYGPTVKDVLTVSPKSVGFVGAKPEAWTRWVLGMLGFDPSLDTVDDIFHGSGSVTAAIDQIRQQIAP
jgi:hypothetical protein